MNFRFRPFHPLAALLLPLISAKSSLSAPLHFGGGNASIVDGTPLLPAAGDWTPGSIENWSLDVGPAFDYTAWTNGDTAIFDSTAAGYTVNVTAAATVGGLSAAGSEVGTTIIQGSDVTAKAFTFASGATINTPAGTTLKLLSNTAHALTITTSSFNKAGAGTFIFDSTTVGNANAAGTIDVQDGILRIIGDRAGPFTAQALNLSGANAVFETGQLAAASGNFTGTQFTNFSGVEGSQIRSVGTGVSHVSWNNSTIDGILEGVVLKDGISSGSQLGFVKGGNKTLTFNQPNFYSGGTTVYNGKLVAEVGGAVPGPVYVTNTGVFEPSYEGLQPTSISVQDGGKLISKPSIDLSTVELLTGAALEYKFLSDLPSEERGIPDWSHGIVSFGFEADTSTMFKVPGGFDGVIALSANSANDLDFSFATGASLEYARLGATGTVTYSGILTPADLVYYLGGSGTLTLDQTLALTGARDLDVGALPVAGRVNNPGNSTVVLSGANDISGNLTVGKYSTLRLEGGSGSLASIANVRLNGGTLTLADTAAGGNGNRIGDETPIGLVNGGTINYLGTRGSTEALGTVTIYSGEANISASGTGLGTSGNAILRIGGLGSSRGAETTVTFTNGTNNLLRFATIPPLVNGVVGGWAIAGGANFADFNPANGQPRQITPAIIASDTDFNAVSPTGNYTIDSAVTVTTQADRSVNSLRAHFATGGPFIVDLGATLGAGISNTLTIDSGGLLLSSGTSGTLAGGAITAGAAGGNRLFVFATGSTKTLSSTIVDNGAQPVTLVKAGGNQLILTSANSYSGGTVINNGNLQVATSANVAALGTGTIRFDGLGTTLSLGNNVTPRTFANEIEVNADSTFSVPSGQGINVTFSGPVILGQDSIWTIAGNVTSFSGAISGSGSLRLTQGATFNFSGSQPNTFTGSTVITNGTLNLNKPTGVQAIGGDVFLGDIDGVFATETLSLGNSEQINDNSILTLSGGLAGNQGIFKLNGNKTETIGGLRSGLANGIVENGGAAATLATLIISTQRDSSFGGNIRNNAAGDLNRTLTLIKTGPSLQGLAGVNSYTGATTVHQGTLQLDGTLTQSVLTVNEDGGLTGRGIISQNAIINGWHRPGNVRDLQTFAGSVEYGAGSRLEVALNQNAAGGNNALVAGGGITVIPGAAVDVILNLPLSTVTLGDDFWTQPQTWIVATAANITGEFALGTVSADPEGSAVGDFGAFSLSQTATELKVVWTPGGTVSPLQSWRLAHLGSSANSGDSADNADPDHDGISNLLEFALHTNPGEQNPSPVKLSKPGQTLEFRYTRSKVAWGYLNKVVVEWSDDLVTWSSEGIEETVLSENGDEQEVSAQVPLGSSGKRFVHLNVVTP